MRESRLTRQISLKVTEAEFNHCDRLGDKSKYIRELIKQDMGGEDLIKQKVREVLETMGFNTEIQVQPQKPEVIPEIKPNIKPEMKAEVVKEIQNNVTKSIKNIFNMDTPDN